MQEIRLELPAIFENIPIIAIIVDEEMQVRVLNRSAVEFLGRPAEQVIGLRIGEAFHCFHSLDHRKGCGFGFFCKQCALHNTVLDTLKNSKSHYRVDAKLPLIFGEKQKEMYLLISSIPIRISGGYRAQVYIEDITEYKKAEEELRSQHEFIKNTIESLIHPFYVIDANDYTIKMANSAACLGNLSKDLTCYTLTHRGSKPCHATKNPCPLEKVKKTKKSAIAEHIHYDEYGNARNIEVHSYPIFDSEGDVSRIIECNLDITKRKRMSDELLRRNRELSLLNQITKATSKSFNMRNILKECLGIMIKEMNLYAGAAYLFNEKEENLELIANRRISKQFLKEIKLLNIDGFLHLSLMNEGKAKIINDLQQEAHKTYQLLAKYYRAEKIPQSLAILPLIAKENLRGIISLYSIEKGYFNEEILNLLDSVCCHLAMAIHNIQLYKELQRERNEAIFLKGFSNKIVENVTTGIITVDRQSKVTFLNPIAEEILGVELQEIGGKPIYEMIKFGMPSKRPFLRAMRNKRTYERIETTLSRKDGKTIPVGMSVSPFKNDRGNISGAVGILADLTEIKHMAEERRRIQDLATVGEMSARLAHELKNPLSCILAGLQLFQLDKQLGKKQKKYIEILLSEVDRMSKLIADLLNFSQHRRLFLSEENIVEILDKILFLLRASLRKKEIMIEKMYASDLPRIQADKDQIEELFLNIFINSLDAVKVNGRIRIKILQSSISQEKIKRNEDYHIPRNLTDIFTDAASRKKCLVVMVSDNGIGIPFENMDKIFQPFFSAKKHGTGLGLAIVSKIITKHRGIIGVRSIEGKSTTISAYFPLE